MKTIGKSKLKPKINLKEEKEKVIAELLKEYANNNLRADDMVMMALNTGIKLQKESQPKRPRRAPRFTEKDRKEREEKWDREEKIREIKALAIELLKSPWYTIYLGKVSEDPIINIKRVIEVSKTFEKLISETFNK